MYLLVSKCKWGGAGYGSFRSNLERDLGRLDQNVEKRCSLHGSYTGSKPRGGSVVQIKKCKFILGTNCNNCLRTHRIFPSTARLLDFLQSGKYLKRINFYILDFIHLHICDIFVYAFTY